jgi:hypothetical protein
MKLILRLLNRLCVSALVAATLINNAHAGRECAPHTPSANTVAQSFSLAEHVTRLLDTQAARIAIVARVGSDQSKRGVRYTHVAFAQREHAKGRWTVTHLLNVCGEETADLYDEGLANFFLDDLFAMEAKVVVPSEPLQDRLIEAINSPLKRALFEPQYSLIANPWETRFQNSNNWALELIAAATAPRRDVGNRRQAQEWLRSTGYQPTRIAIGAGERAGTRLFAANIRYSDHPDTAWQTQRYEVATGDSVLRYVERVDMNAAVYLIDNNKAPTTLRATAPAVEPRHTQAPTRTGTTARSALNDSSGEMSSSSASREQVLVGARSLVTGYACRDAGYLRQCHELSAARCETLVKTAVSECFAPVSDRDLTDAQRNSALGMVEKVGLCAVAHVDTSLDARYKRAYTLAGESCADFRRYQSAAR